MRSMRAAHPRTDQPPFECRVRFTGRLADAVLVSPDSPLPSVRPRPAVPTPPPAPQPPSAPPQPPVNPAEFWKTEIAHELTADRAKVEALLGELRRSMAAFREDQAGRLREWQRAAVELATTIATRLLHERITANDFPVEVRVRDMLDQVEQDAPATVYLNPDDLALLESRLAGEPLLPDRDDPRLVPDPDLSRGACRVEGKESVLLSDLTRELQEIRDELLRSLGNARS